ncbi:MAG: hypothetical protein NT045_00420, partial [Candidatus Aureabacteria bacterium]|nr:hypothetical protein [Candidatus Auribacterota bacterium]
MRCRTGAASVLRLIPIILVLSLFCSGCAELSTTARIMNIAFIELFRLPIYVMKLPFQILQSLGPALQAAMRTAGNMAPLLLFIENKTPGEKLYASIEEPLDIQVERAFKERQGIPLLPLMEEEMHNEGAKRFLLVDARIVG